MSFKNFSLSATKSAAEDTFIWQAKAAQHAHGTGTVHAAIG